MKPIENKNNPDVFSWILPSGYGKYETHDQWFRRDEPLSDTAPECFIFYRTAIEQGDVSSINWLMAPSRSGRLRGRIHFAVDGYGDEERELYEIPEVRSFFAALFDYLPCGIYFASSVDGRPIQFLAACTCDPLWVFKAKGSGNVCLRIEEAPLHRFCMDSFQCHTHLCERINLEPSDTLEHFATVLELLINRPQNAQSLKPPET